MTFVLIIWGHDQVSLVLFHFIKQLADGFMQIYIIQYIYYVYTVYTVCIVYVVKFYIKCLTLLLSVGNDCSSELIKV